MLQKKLPFNGSSNQLRLILNFFNFFFYEESLYDNIQADYVQTSPVCLGHFAHCLLRKV